MQAPIRTRVFLMHVYLSPPVLSIFMRTSKTSRLGLLSLGLFKAVPTLTFIKIDNCHIGVVIGASALNLDCFLMTLKFLGVHYTAVSRLKKGPFDQITTKNVLLTISRTLRSDGFPSICFYEHISRERKARK